jgi:predicted nucleic acid-binding protein
MILIIDTNEIISALIRDSSSRRILLSPRFFFYTPDFTLTEIQRHIPLIERKTSLSRKDVLLLLNTLMERVQVMELKTYEHKYKEAKSLIGKIDPDDVPFIALALSLPNDGIWSSDKHLLKQERIKIWATQDLLKRV